MNNLNNEVFTVKDLCSLLKISKNTAYDLIHSGAIRYIKIGRQIRIPRESVVRFLNKTEDGFP